MQDNETQVEVQEQPAAKGFNFNKAFQSDPDKELNGSWTTITVGDDTLQIMLARKDNEKATAYFRNLLRVNERQLEPDDDAANRLFQDIRRRVIARCIIKDWKNLIIDGQDTPYSEEVCLELLKFKDFMDAVEIASGDFSVFRASELEKILKN